MLADQTKTAQGTVYDQSHTEGSLYYCRTKFKIVGEYSYNGQNMVNQIKDDKITVTRHLIRVAHQTQGSLSDYTHISADQTSVTNYQLLNIMFHVC